MVATIIVYFTVSAIFVIAGYTGYHELFGSASLDVNVVNIVGEVIPLPHVQIPMIEIQQVITLPIIDYNMVQNQNVLNDVVQAILADNKLDFSLLNQFDMDSKMQIMEKVVSVVEDNMYSSDNIYKLSHSGTEADLKRLCHMETEFYEWAKDKLLHMPEAERDYIINSVNVIEDFWYKDYKIYRIANKIV